MGYHNGNCVIRNCYASGSVKDGTGGGLVGYNYGRVYNSYYNSSNTGTTIGFPVSVDDLKKADTYYFWDFENIWDINGSYPYPNVRGDEREIEFFGDGLSDDPYLIESEEQLYALSVDLAVNTSQVYYQMTDDISINATAWTPIGAYSAFLGTFDGDGHTISGVKISKTGHNYIGLFGMNSGKIQNLTVNGSVSGNGEAGLLAGRNNGSIVNCFTSGGVTNTADCTGGLVGHSYGTISNSGSTATVSECGQSIAVSMTDIRICVLLFPQKMLP